MYSQVRFITVKGYRVKLAKGRVHGVKSGGSQAQASECHLPGESQRLCFIFQQPVLTTPVMSTDEAQRVEAPKVFYWRLLLSAPSASPEP